MKHDDVIKWKHFPRYWPFVWGIHRWPRSLIDVFFDLRPNKRLSKQSWGWWFETPSHSLWRHRYDLRENNFAISTVSTDRPPPLGAVRRVGKLMKIFGSVYVYNYLALQALTHNGIKWSSPLFVLLLWEEHNFLFSTDIPVKYICNNINVRSQYIFVIQFSVHATALLIVISQYTRCIVVNGLFIPSACISKFHGPLTRYVKLWVAHAPGMPGTFSPPSISKGTAS